MDFDEYDYLEKMSETPELQEVKKTVNGVDEALKSGDNERSRSSKHRSDDNYRDSEYRSKRTRSGDVTRDPEKHRERGSLSRDGERSEKDRHRRSSRERREKNRDKDREERNGRDREREWKPDDCNHDRRDQNRKSERAEKGGRGWDRESNREKGKLREGNGEREQHEHSQRSSSNSERLHCRDDRDWAKDRDREFIENERGGEVRERERFRRHKGKKEDVAEPEEADPERDQRTVFAYQICLKADERDVYEFFSRAGKVRDVRLIMDRSSRRSKGVGYIEFYDAMSVPMAIALSGQPLLGHPVMVKPSEAEKNLVQSTTIATGGPGGLIGPYTGGARRLYVGNVHFNITEDQLRQVFEPFGTVELVQLPLDQETGHCKGFGFVQFAHIEDARSAQSLNGQLEIAGRVIKVSAVADQAGMQDVGANAADFDDDEGGGLSLNARSRAILMQKLDRTGTASSFPGSLGTSVVNTADVTLPIAPILGAAPVVSSLALASLPALAGLPGVGLSVPAATVGTVGIPSECLLLNNMFDPSLETEPDFDLDIKEDVQDECKKFGILKHIHVEKNSTGFVYLRFENTESAMNAQRALHGRWFAGKMITAIFMLPQNYEAKFSKC